MNGVYFDDIHSYRDLNLILSPFTPTPAVPQTNLLQVPGRDGLLDLTEANGAVFDVDNRFAGCIPGLHYVLMKQGLMEGTWCLNHDEVLSPGQAEAIERARTLYPELVDDEFVKAFFAQEA